MRRRLPGVLMAGLIVLALPLGARADKPAAAQEPYVFTIDGEPFSPAVISLDGDPEHPKPGDLIRVDDLLLVLGPERQCHFITTPRDDGRLLLKAADGAQRVVGANVGWTYKEQTKIVFNPLEKMSAEEIGGLWGLRLDEWPDGIAGQLAHLDPARTCVTVTDNAAQPGTRAFPPLPEGLRCLCVRERSSQGIKDYAPLARHKSLRVLVLDAMGRGPFDARLIEGAKDLRYLDLSGNRLAHAASLGKLAALVHLDLRHADDLGDVRFAAALPSLRRLDVSRTDVNDLSPLAGLDSLQWLSAEMAPVEKLPDGKLPALRRLSLFSTRVSDEAAAAFAKAHPQCKVLHRWAPAFREAVAGTTRIRVRSGGTCHRRIDEEKTLAEVTEAAEIRKLIDGIDIDEEQSGFHCMCCGDPSIEFYRGKELVATLGYHHGRSLRWPGGWPSDGMLTQASRELLSKWLTSRGVTGPQKEIDEEEERQAAARRRSKRYEKLLPDKTLAALRSVRSAEEAAKAFRETVPDAGERALVFLRLYGCDHASWNLYAGLDGPLSETFLPGVDQTAFSAALAKAADDPAALNGAARWIFNDRKTGAADEKTLAAALPALARAGLSHPRQYNRRDTMLALARINTPQAVALLRECLAGKIEVRALPKGEEGEPGGKVVFRPGGNPWKEEVSDRACAASVLAGLGDQESLPAIEALAAKATGEEKKVLDEALSKLRAAAKR